MSGEENVSGLLRKLSGSCSSSPVFHAALGLLLSQCVDSDDSAALAEFLKKQMDCSLEVGGDPSNFNKVTVSVNPLSVAFSGSKPVVAVPAAVSVEAGNGELPLPSNWLVKIDNIALITPKVKGSLYLCVDRWCVSVENKCYHISIENIKNVCKVPAPNGQEMYQGVALQPNTPLLLGKTKHTVQLFKYETSDELKITVQDVNNVIAQQYEGKSTGIVANTMIKFKESTKLDVELVKLIQTVHNSQVRIKVPRPFTFLSANNVSYIPAYYKASDGPLYCQEDGLFFVGKPLLYLCDIESYKWESCGGRSSDLTLLMKLEGNAKKPVTHQFGLIPQEEVSGVTKYLDTIIQNSHMPETKTQTNHIVNLPVGNTGVRKSERADVINSSMGVTRLTDANDFSDDDDDAFDESDVSESSGTDDDEDDEDDHIMADDDETINDEDDENLDDAHSDSSNSNNNSDEETDLQKPKKFKSQ